MPLPGGKRLKDLVYTFFCDVAIFFALGYCLCDIILSDHNFTQVCIHNTFPHVSVILQMTVS